MGKKKNRIKREEKREKFMSMNFKELKEYLNKNKIEFFEMEDTEEEIVCIYWCQVGDNFYDYGEKPPKHMNFKKDLEFLKDDPRINFIECCNCCGCAGW